MALAFSALSCSGAGIGQDGVMGIARRRWFLPVLQVAVAVGLFALVWRIAGGGSTLQLLAGANLGWVLAAIGVLSLQIVLSAFRWRITAGQLGIALPRATAVGEYYLSQIINQTLPGGILGDAGRAVRARGQAGLMASGQAVILERFAGQVGLLAVLGVGFAVSLTVPGGSPWPGWLATLVATLLVLAVFTTLLLAPSARLLPPRVGAFLTALHSSARHALMGRRVRGTQLGLSLTTALANIAGVVLCAKALGVDVEFGAAVVIVPLLLFTMLIPITVSGWGLREAAAVALFPLAGLSVAEGLATSIAFGVTLIVSALPGLYFLRARSDSVSA